MDSGSIVITCNGVALPTPTVFKITESDGDSSNTNRSQNWILRRDRVRPNIKAVSVEWVCSAADAATIRNAISPAGFDVTLQFLGTTTTHTMYAGDRSFEAATLRGSERWSVSFTLTEF